MSRTSDARLLGKAVRQSCPVNFRIYVAPCYNFVAAGPQELAALESGLRQAQSITKSASAGASAAIKGSLAPQTEDEATSRAPQTHAGPKLVITELAEADGLRQGTPWTEHNAALPAYPAQFTPQLPFTSGLWLCVCVDTSTQHFKGVLGCPTCCCSACLRFNCSMAILPALPPFDGLL